MEKICQACEADGAPLPEYTVHPGDIMIKFTAANTITSANTHRVTEKVTEKVTDQVTDQVTVNELRALELLLEDPAYTYLALSTKLGVSRKTVAALISSLKEKGIIERIGSDKSGYWKINQ